ncbi:MAG: hypothetical protein ACLQU2_34025 [Candidatus Binataceae bacterium]
MAARYVSNARPLDFQHFRAEPRQQLRACRPRLYAREVDNFDSFQWQRHDQRLLFAMSSEGMTARAADPVNHVLNLLVWINDA